MGVDTKITLPPHVAIGNVSDVIGILLGCKKEKVNLEYGTDGAWGVRVLDVGLSNYDLPLMPCARISVRGPTLWDCMYHFEFNGDGARGLMPTSTPLNCALGTSLVYFFGGEIDYNDCDDEPCDFKHSSAVSLWGSTTEDDGEPWQFQQELIWAVQPMEDSYIRSFADVAAR